MTIQEMVEKYHMTKEEKEWVEKLISMMMCLRKYEHLSRISQNGENKSYSA